MILTTPIGPVEPCRVPECRYKTLRPSGYCAVHKGRETRDPHSPQWEDCKVCGGDHWTRDHDAVHFRYNRQAVTPP